jgi:hypothetical protein
LFYLIKYGSKEYDSLVAYYLDMIGLMNLFPKGLSS